MDFKPIFVQAGVFICKFGIFLYDILTLPIFTIINQPWIHWKKKNIVWSKLEDENDPYSCYVRQVHHKRGRQVHQSQTLDELFRHSTDYFSHSKCLGTREQHGEEDFKAKSGKVFKKLILGEYKWLTYEEAEKKVDAISKGLLSIGVTSKKPIVILAETRVEWFLTAHACFRINVPVVTLYATLGEDGLAHGINETEVTHIVTSVDLLSKLNKLFQKIPKVTHVVYMEGLHPPATDVIPNHVNLMAFNELEEQGKKTSDVSYIPPQSEDLAILMYTSGSTGTPKGVMITNKNVMATINGIHDIIETGNFGSKDSYIAYLPIAHVLELAVECYVSSLGVKIGYSSPQTLTNFSTAIKPGSLGDLSVLKPTIMAAVPLMLDRIRKSILQLAGQDGSFMRMLFDFAVDYKKFWLHRGYETPLLDRFVMKTYHDFMGGHLQLCICGGAPISPDTQDFIRSCLKVQVIQGYGMTETAASSTVMDLDDYSTGRVGAPLSTCRMRLVDWDEGNYHVSDQPNPRGEIVVGGDSVTLGYFKLSEQTKDNFKEERGSRWFYTGDIGEVFPNGSFKIIDRKKDLVKLAFGEYIALGKVEAELKTCPLVENICVLGRGSETYLIALIIPNRPNVERLAKDIGKGELTFEQICNDYEIARAVTKKLREHGATCKLFGSELPQKVKLCSEDWHPESGLVTAALKIRRKMIEEFYAKDIEELYTSPLENGSAGNAAKLNGHPNIKLNH